MQQRRDEILAKRAKLTELKRQRELRAASQASTGRTSITSPGDLGTSTPNRDSRREIESLIDSLVRDSRPVSTSTGGAASPAHRSSRPNSVLSAGELSNETSEYAAPANGQVAPPQITLTTVALTTIYECPPSPVKEVFSYSKGVQTTEEWNPPSAGRQRAHSLSDAEDGPLPGAATSTPSKRLSRRERDREEELRQNIRREIEEELRAARELLDPKQGGPLAALQSTNFPARTLTAEEVRAVGQSDEFLDFMERSSKVIERALDESYDILIDYGRQGTLEADGDEDDYDGGSGAVKNTGGKGRRRVKEVAQFYDERWSRKRMISSLDFSPRHPEIFLASYTKNPAAPHEPDGVVQVWNMHLHDRPEFVFTAQSDVLAARFSPFHPNIIVGGSYSGQVLLWDTRARSSGGAPVQKTPLTGSGHTHPVYAVDMVGTQNAHNIISCSTDGVVCGWSVDVFAQPQESLELKLPSPAKIEDVSPTCLAFPQADPTFFLVGSEEGRIYPCHRYDRAGAKAGVDAKTIYRGHTAPVMSVDFHPARGPVDLGDLVLSSSLDWSVKLWKARAPAATSTANSDDNFVAPLLEFVREDVVYDARWSPIKPGVFALVDGAGWLELWDVTVETEEPVARISPSPREGGRLHLAKSLNKLAWEPTEGKRVAVGGIDGTVTVFEVAAGLGGREDLKAEEWTNVKKLVNRIEAVGVNGVVVV